ncbi:hypothetical protein B484DRAFT_402104 [Ochromonadaceae sp. CCMP2298]|nr:hypothetical protein B484DRAFT_402104 [Ochromonadaceae sp. CCMP2298]
MAEDEANGGRSARERKPVVYSDCTTNDSEFGELIRQGNKRVKGKPQKQLDREAAQAIKEEADREAEAKVVALREKEVKRVKGKSKPPPAPTSLQRQQDELEERHIAKGRERKKGSNRARRMLPEGQVTVEDMQTAVRRSFKETTTPLLDWSSPKCKMIGGNSKIWWDGDNKWFYARILNYDSFYDKHYIFYADDLQAEWIDLTQEPCMVGEQMVYARLTPTSAPWAAQTFWASDKAWDMCAKFKGYKKEGVYVEYFGTGQEKNIAYEYAFSVRTNLTPMQDAFGPTRPSAQFKKGVALAGEELALKEEIVRMVEGALGEVVFGALSGEQWVGMRVRASTHRLVQAGESRETVLGQGSAYSVGTVARYRPSSGMHLVVFDTEALQPQWVLCQRGSVEILLGADAGGDESSLPPATRRLMEGARVKSADMCALCHSRLDSLAQTCSQCSVSAHRYCIDEEGGVSGPDNWVCWDCTVCFGCVGTSWDKSLLPWNTLNVEADGPDNAIEKRPP